MIHVQFWNAGFQRSDLTLFETVSRDRTEVVDILDEQSFVCFVSSGYGPC